MARQHTYNRRKPNIFMIIGMILLELVMTVVLMIVILKAGIRFCYHTFYRDAEQVFELPEFASEFVPQGLEYCEEQDVYLISGYIYKANNSRIYVVKPDGSYRCVRVMRDAKNPLRSHSGGICENGAYVYLAGGNGKCYVFKKEELLDDSSDVVYVAGEIKTGNTASFCCAENGYLYVGEYYYRFKYVTRYDHHVTTPAGDANNAVITAFALDESEENGVRETPVFGLSVPGRIQGMCVSENGQLVLSASSIFQGGQLYYYDYDKILNGESGELNIWGQVVPLYYADSDGRLFQEEILPKSEEICYQDGDILMLFESACDRFRYGALLDAQYVYRKACRPNE